MFGENLMLGNAIIQTEPKGRIYIPKRISVVEQTDEIAIVRGENYLKLYNLKLLKAKIEEEIAKNYFSSSKSLEETCANILGVVTPDSAKRIYIPKKMVTDFEMKSELIVCGFGNHCRIYNDIDEYKKNIK